MNEPLSMYEGGDANLRLILGKFGKKDATTKRKALDDWIAYIETHKPIEIRPALPHWFYMYQKLAFDHDRRVREATQRALYTLVRLIFATSITFSSVLGY